MPSGQSKHIPCDCFFKESTLVASVSRVKVGRGSIDICKIDLQLAMVVKRKPWLDETFYTCLNRYSLNKAPVERGTKLFLESTLSQSIENPCSPFCPKQLRSNSPEIGQAPCSAVFHTNDPPAFPPKTATSRSIQIQIPNPRPGRKELMFRAAQRSRSWPWQTCFSSFFRGERGALAQGEMECGKVAQ